MKLSSEKEFKQEIYGIERLIEHEDRMKERQKELEFEQEKLRKE
jgi:hypothetical protein